ncbi:MAG: DUF799 family lipoprotein [Nitrospirota bacterium]|nr:DUF799 family lipoprotein [Nitrospirota bacterium]
MLTKKNIRQGIFCIFLLALAACTTTAPSSSWHDPIMDFGVVETVAVMPFENMTRDNLAADRVRDVFTTMLLSSGGVYILPTGEVMRGINRAAVARPVTPSPEEVMKFGAIVKADAVITGTVKEYGEVRSGTTSANIVSISMRMFETKTGRIVWSASSTQGGITAGDRLLGGGGQPMDIVTVKAVNDIIDKLYK